MIPVIVKLILLPFIVVIMMNLTRLDELIVYVLVIQSMMPALTLSSVLFAKSSRDDTMGALVTVVCTIASLLVIPLMLYVINSFLIKIVQIEGRRVMCRSFLVWLGLFSDQKILQQKMIIFYWRNIQKSRN